MAAGSRSRAHGSSAAAAWHLPVGLLPPQLTPKPALGFLWCYRHWDRAGCSMNPDTGAELKKQENSQWVLTGLCAQATCPLQLAPADKCTFFQKKSILRNQFFRNLDLIWYFLQILFPLADLRDKLRTTCTQVTELNHGSLKDTSFWSCLLPTLH